MLLGMLVNSRRVEPNFSIAESQLPRFEFAEVRCGESGIWCHRNWPRLVEELQSTSFGRGCCRSWADSAVFRSRPSELRWCSAEGRCDVRRSSTSFRRRLAVRKIVKARHPSSRAIDVKSGRPSVRRCPDLQFKLWVVTDRYWTDWTKSVTVFIPFYYYLNSLTLSV